MIGRGTVKELAGVSMRNCTSRVSTRRALSSPFELVLLTFVAVFYLSTCGGRSVETRGQLLHGKGPDFKGVCVARQENLLEGNCSARSFEESEYLKDHKVIVDLPLEMDMAGTSEISWHSASLKDVPDGCSCINREDSDRSRTSYFEEKQLYSTMEPVCAVDGALQTSALRQNYAFLRPEGERSSRLFITSFHDSGVHLPRPAGLSSCTPLRFTGANALHLNSDWHLLSEGSKIRGLRYVSDRGWLLEKTHEGSWRIKAGLFTEEVVAYSHAKSEFPGDSRWWSRSDLHHRLVQEQQQLMRRRDQWIEERTIRVECVKAVPTYVEATGALYTCSPDGDSSPGDFIKNIMAKQISSIRKVSEKIPCVVCSPTVPDEQRDLLFGLCRAISLPCERDDANASFVSTSQFMYPVFRISTQPTCPEAFVTAASVLLRIVKREFRRPMLEAYRSSKFKVSSVAQMVPFAASTRLKASRTLALLRKCQRVTAKASGVTDAVSCTGSFSRVNEDLFLTKKQSIFFKVSLDGRRVFLVVSDAGVVCTSDHITSIIMAGVPIQVFKKSPLKARKAGYRYHGQVHSLDGRIKVPCFAIWLKRNGAYERGRLTLEASGSVHVTTNENSEASKCRELNVRGFSHALATLNGRWLLSVNAGEEVSYMRSPTRMGVAVKARRSEFHGYALMSAGFENVKDDGTPRRRTEPTGLLYMYYSKRLGMWVIGPQALDKNNPLKGRGYRVEMTEDIAVAVCPRCAPSISPSGVWASVDATTASISLNLVHLDCIISVPG